MEEIIVLMLKAAWGVVQIFYYSIRFLIQTIFFIRSKIPKSPELYTFPQQARFEHTLVVGGSGHGKTQLLQHLFVQNDLVDALEGRKSVVFIDSQGDMLQKILHLRELAPSRHAPAYQQPRQPEVQQQELEQIAKQEQQFPGQERQEGSAEALPTQTAAIGHLWHACLVFLLLFTLLLLGGVISAFAASLFAGFVTILPLGFATGAWLRKRKRPPAPLPASIGAASFAALCLALFPSAQTVYQLLGLVGVPCLGFILVRPRPVAVGTASAVPAQPIAEATRRQEVGRRQEVAQVTLQNR